MGLRAPQTLSNNSIYSVMDKLELLKKSTDLLEECVGFFPDDETYGNLGSTYKSLSALYKEEGNQLEEMKHFRYALESYGKGFSVSPEKYYCGINYATLLEKEKSHNQDKPKQLAAITELFELTIPRICVALGKVDAIHPRSWDDYWDLATAIELAALSRQWEMGISAMRVH